MTCTAEVSSPLIPILRLSLPRTAAWRPAMVLQDAVGGTDQLLRRAVDLAQKPALQHARQGHHIEVRHQLHVGFRDAGSETNAIISSRFRSRVLLSRFFHL